VRSSDRTTSAGLLAARAGASAPWHVPVEELMENDEFLNPNAPDPGQEPNPTPDS
jgi:hypothetical protein